MYSQVAGPLWVIVVISTTSTAGCDVAERGIAGESCTARNDCRAGLACIRNTCQRASALLPVTGRDCYRVECAVEADCCAAFVPDASCDFYEEACAANPDDCAIFRSLCQCNRRCVSERCADVGPGCARDAECPRFSAPFCVAGRCAGCREHGDCAAEGARCIEGGCVEPCASDTQCPLLHRCEGGLCTEAGCGTDRECAFVLGDGRARCVASECVLSCSDDAECDVARFEVCHAGRCVFAGCETDDECRAYLRLAESRSGAQAVCR